MATYDLRTKVPAISDIKRNDILNCSGAESVCSVTLPNGKYLLECWGSHGYCTASSTHFEDTDHIRGQGGYASGTVSFDSSTTVYLYTGSYVTCSSAQEHHSFNGGGSLYSGYAHDWLGGGGGTHIGLATGELYSLVNNQSSVLLVAGGGGGATDIDDYPNMGGGQGGGTNGIAGTGPTHGGNGGTQTGGGTNYNGTLSSGFGYGACDGSMWDGGNGGGGWYGGGYSYGATGGGGSGHINTTYISDGILIAGNETILEPDGTTAVGHAGKGYIRITCKQLGDGDIAITPYMNHVTYTGKTSGNVGDAINATLTPDTNYTLDSNYGASVSVLAGHSDITSSAYNPTNNSISFILSTTTNIYASAVTLSVDYKLLNCSSSNTAKQIAPGSSYTSTITLSSGYTLERRFGGEVSIMMGEADITETAWDETTKTISIGRVTNDLTITVKAKITTYSQTLSNCTQSGITVGNISYGATLNGTLTPSTNYSLKASDGATVTITMNKVDVTDEVYDEYTHTVQIPVVTGPVVLTATAVCLTVKSTLTNILLDGNASRTVNICPHTEFTGTLTTTTDLYSWAGATVSITMGGIDITSEVYDSTTHKIDIPDVSAAVVITASSTAPLTISLADKVDSLTGERNVYHAIAYNNTQVSQASNEVYITLNDLPTLENTSQYYTGAPLSPIIRNGTQAGVTQSGTTSATTTGTYTITWTRLNSSMWKETTSSARSASTRTGTWTISNNDITVIHSIPDTLTFDDNIPTREYDLEWVGNGCLIGELSTSIGDMTWELSGKKLKLTAHNTFSGTLALSIKGATGFNDATIQTITITSTKTDDRQYGDGTLNTTSNAYTNRILFNGEHIYEHPESEQTTSYNIRYAARVNKPDCSTISLTPLSDIIPSQSGTESSMSSWGWTCPTQGRLTYLSGSGSKNVTINFAKAIPGNSVVNLFGQCAGSGLPGQYKFNCNGVLFSIQEMVKYGICAPLVLISAAANRTDRIGIVRNALSLYSYGQPAYTSGYYGSGSHEVLFILNRGYSISGMFAGNNWSSSYSGTCSFYIGYCSNKICNLTLAPEEEETE